MKIALLTFCALGVVTSYALPVSSMSDVQRQQRCGEDLRCYFNADEIQIALGEKSAWTNDILQPGADRFAAEDEGEHFHDEADAALVQISSDRNAPIWSAFIANFRSCAQGCVPADYSTYGSRERASCHNTGQAIDVGAIVCGGHTYKAISGGRFAKFVNCMGSKMKALYRNGRGVTRGHHDHAHFSNGCTVAGGRRYY